MGGSWPATRVHPWHSFPSLFYCRAPARRIGQVRFLLWSKQTLQSNKFLFVWKHLGFWDANQSWLEASFNWNTHGRSRRKDGIDSDYETHSVIQERLTCSERALDYRRSSRSPWECLQFLEQAIGTHSVKFLHQRWWLDSGIPSPRKQNSAFLRRRRRSQATNHLWKWRR